MFKHKTIIALAIAAASVVGLGACSSSRDAAPTTEAPRETEAPAAVTVTPAPVTTSPATTVATAPPSTAPAAPTSTYPAAMPEMAPSYVARHSWEGFSVNDRMPDGVTVGRIMRCEEILGTGQDGGHWFYAHGPVYPLTCDGIDVDPINNFRYMMWFTANTPAVWDEFLYADMGAEWGTLDVRSKVFVGVQACFDRYYHSFNEFGIAMHAYFDYKLPGLNIGSFMQTAYDLAGDTVCKGSDGWADSTQEFEMTTIACGGNEHYRRDPNSQQAVPGYLDELIQWRVDHREYWPFNPSFATGSSNVSSCLLG